MQCPACNADSPVAAYGDPLRCPGCGAFYEKAVQASVKEKTPAQGSLSKSAERMSVVVVDFNMSFTSMVNFMIKLALASIPAFLVLLGITIGFLLFTGVLGHLVR
ncbi:hypothetical protein D9M69_729980 [compost metagenome]